MSCAIELLNRATEPLSKQTTAHSPRTSNERMVVSNSPWQKDAPLLFKSLLNCCRQALYFPPANPVLNHEGETNKHRLNSTLLGYKHIIAIDPNVHDKVARGHCLDGRRRRRAQVPQTNETVSSSRVQTVLTLMSERANAVAVALVVLAAAAVDVENSLRHLAPRAPVQNKQILCTRSRVKKRREE